jgi:hypothetical protein
MMQYVHVKLNDCHMKRRVKKYTFHQQIILTFKEETSKLLYSVQEFYVPEILRLSKVDHKYLERFEIW